MGIPQQPWPNATQIREDSGSPDPAPIVRFIKKENCKSNIESSAQLE